MPNKPEMDSNLALALGLLGATIVAALVVLILPAVVGPHLKAEALPAAQIITTSDKAASDAAAAFQQLPKAQRPPDTLLEPASAPRRALASSR
jgi:hypothetical protein